MNPKKARILIAEDSAALRGLLEECLLDQGYEVITRPDGLAAWERIETDRPDVLVTDNRMPRLTGIELLARVTRTYPDLPVIFMTSEGSEEIAAEAISRGAVSYLIKGSRDILRALENSVAQCVYRIQLELENRRLVEELRRQKAELEITVKERTADLRAALEKTQALDKLKGDFITLLSHEIRTPLTSILGFSEVLDQGLYEGAAELAEILGYIYSSGQRLSEFVNDAIELFRWYSGMQRLDYDRVQVSDWVDRSILKLEQTAGQKGHHLETRVPEDLWVEADPAVVENALDRVLDNAVKFTPAGGRIVVRAHQISSIIRVGVEDNGIGFDIKGRESIFRPLQICGDINHHSEGKGLSMALVKEAIRAHGGDVVIESEGPGEGALVTLCLPVNTPPEERQSQTSLISHPILTRLNA